jgi:hypothetical protein
MELVTSLTVNRTVWMGDRHVARPLSTPDRTNRINARQTSLPLVGFETTTPIFERAKIFHALDCAATAISLTASGKEDV